MARLLFLRLLFQIIFFREKKGGKTYQYYIVQRRRCTVVETKWTGYQQFISEAKDFISAKGCEKKFLSPFDFLKLVFMINFLIHELNFWKLLVVI